MYKVILENDSNLFGFDFSAESLKPIFVNEYETKKEAVNFFNTYVKENNCTKPRKKAYFAHHDGKEISCNF